LAEETPRPADNKAGEENEGDEPERESGGKGSCSGLRISMWGTKYLGRNREGEEGVMRGEFLSFWKIKNSQKFSGIFS